ncbi:MAG: heparinase II/III family protein [bacterium]
MKFYINKKYKNIDLNVLFKKNFLPDLNFDKIQIKKTATLSKENCFLKHCFKKHCFKIFNKSIRFKNKINWHQDFNSNITIPAWQNAYYQNIKIQALDNSSFKRFHPDIKIPWELSRLQHIPKLALVNDENTFKNHINNWIDQNPFLIGVNWACPMDVAIRAINSIYGFHLFENKSLIDDQFWNKLINSLYQHAIYLENNFEIFYKPNNHYIADLIGYFYLCFLFDHKKHFQKAKIKTYKKILKQFDLQIQEDGTSYEGSTNYHKLVIEMFLHFYYLCKKNNLSLSDEFITKLNKAQEFIQDCADNSGNFVQIGDNDSGKILNNPPIINNTPIKQPNKTMHYPNFGLTIIKNNDWHITYRHSTYNKKQPTGHFHQDALSITLTYKGIPILIDPGTYVYNSNKKWRNLMRGYNSHNTFYIDTENIEAQDLFLLNKKEQNDTSQIIKEQNEISIKNFAQHKHAIAYRELIFDRQKLFINDYWENNLQEISSWNFIFHPKIELKKINENKFEIFYESEKIFYLESSLIFLHKKGFYSREYGVIEKCPRLFAHKAIDKQKNKTVLYPTKT